MSEGSMTQEEREAFLAGLHVGVRAAGRATLTVQAEAAPYKYVSVEGAVVLEPAMHDELVCGPSTGAPSTSPSSSELRVHRRVTRRCIPG